MNEQASETLSVPIGPEESWETHLYLSKNHLSGVRNDAFETKWAWQHLRIAIELLRRDHSNIAELDKFLATNGLVASVDTPPTPTKEVLWRACGELEAILAHKRLSRFLPANIVAGIPRAARDLAIVLVTLVTVFILYRSYHDLPVNLWTNNISAMDVTIKSSTQGYGVVQINKTTAKVPVMVNGKYYPKAIGVHARSVLNIKMRKEGKFFKGGCAYPDSVTVGEIVCSIVMPNGGEIWNSGKLNKDRRYHGFVVELLGKYEMALNVVSTKNDITQAHAAWVELEVD